MEFKEQIMHLGNKFAKVKEQVQTEEATKNALIMPFLQALGYDVFNPLEVVPEYVTDIGTKKGEKIDYAIIQNDNPAILIECKHWSQNLNLHDGQLLRYFHVSKAKFGLLTNGIDYRFYSDLIEPNKMDEKPFLEFNITDIKDSQVQELKKFHKTEFNSDLITNTASELKYANEIQQLLQKEFESPSANFTKLFAKQVYPGTVSAKVLSQFTSLVKRSIQSYISDLVTDRLNIALQKENVISNNIDNIANIKIPENKINTTQEELEGFVIIKTILRQKIDGSRVNYRDAQGYFSILVDRKAIYRLYLNNSKKYFSIIGENKKEIKYEIDTIDDIFNYSDDILKTIIIYDKL